ncbi:CRISPR-associated DxTHG motif protein [Sulfolobus sp. A20-N-F6]|nr:CRISPR-associated DxTHG motif protein [Sulfolobus sp. A20-N-F8]TRM78990.1 CRISPR-associated DxTHG motif protein [Sulfolobus sp. B5]TRM81996.1 CRISPR-associated DxTHG motif protein [Sulfolobus sp. A20-N-F6]TRM83207.1 CRISPR-associated DxTHG motif protein [Sulfolobus sp. F3]TRM86678.1 CRISPR-associated DxTHG motif protein [Sulfolobus sp. C3]TRM92978.1 CRISPR-associated DxTHG motif protein [Sulfolobus sp. A20-N-G8]TRM98047.1 CRISPR-associated DxTHG motif protein [Sulfolobus sp. B1]TRM98427.1
MKNHEVLVLPSRIEIKLESEPTPYYTSFSSTSDYDFMYSVGLVALYEKINQNVEEIIVDTTHGINYFTIMTQLLARDLASILSVKQRETKVKVSYYNAIPKTIGEFLMAKVYSDAKPSIRALDQLSNNELRIAYNTLNYNAPLALVYFLKEFNEKIPKLDEIYSKVKLSEEQGKLRVDYNLIGQGVKKMNDTYLKLLMRTIKDNFNVNGDVSVKLLRDITDIVYKLISEASSSIIIRELDKLFNCVRDNAEMIASKGKVNYKDIYPMCTQSNTGEAQGCEEVLSEDNKRNFIAHGGLLEEIVEIKVTNEVSKENIFLSYGKCWEKVKEFLSK